MTGLSTQVSVRAPGSRIVHRGFVARDGSGITSCGKTVTLVWKAVMPLSGRRCRNCARGQW